MSFVFFRFVIQAIDAHLLLFRICLLKKVEAWGVENVTVISTFSVRIPEKKLPGIF